MNSGAFLASTSETSPVPHRPLARCLGFLLVTGLIALMLWGCGSTPAKRPKPQPETKPQLSGKSYVINGKRYYVLATAEGYVEQGYGSWYGRDFHGRRTSSGEIYNMYELTAAHKTLPLQTWVKVTNLANNKEVTVRVNDRGPFVAGRIIDLSFAGAKHLGMVGPGTSPVRVEALGTAEERVIDGRATTVLVQPDSYRQGHFAVQVGSFRNADNARALAARLSDQYGSVQIETFDRGDAVFYRVQVGDEPTLDQAAARQAQLERQGFKDSFVVAR